MKIRTARYIVKEGIMNIFRNKLVSLASVGIVAASLLIFGVFILAILNFESFLETIKEKPEIRIFCRYELEEEDISPIEQEIKGSLKIKEYKMISKKEALEDLKEFMQTKYITSDEDDDIERTIEEDVLEGLDESFMPISFEIKLHDINDVENVVSQFSCMAGVENIRYSQKGMSIIKNFVYWFNIICVLLIILLLITSIFIISNTIKIAVFARRKEIDIMKYIGATNWFIRWPFIIEGIIVGFLGAGLGFVIVGMIYNSLSTQINSSFENSDLGFIQFLRPENIGIEIILIYFGIGFFVGIFGSMISLRKHLNA